MPPSAVFRRQVVPELSLIMPDRVSVLLVEDDFLIRACLAEFLHDQNLVVHEADSQAEALLHLDSTAPVSVVITDISLPDGDGRAVARHARVRRPALPVIYISGYGDSVTREHDAFSRFISKPYSMMDVLDAVRALTQAAPARP